MWKCDAVEPTEIIWDGPLPEQPPRPRIPDPYVDLLVDGALDLSSGIAVPLPHPEIRNLTEMDYPVPQQDG